MAATTSGVSRPPQPVIIILEAYGGSPRQHSPQLPFIYWDDAAVTRGDGVFESLLVRGGKTMNLQRHFARFEASAKLVGLPAPDKDYWMRSTRDAEAAWAQQTDEDGKMSWTFTRGRRSTGIPTCWIAVQPISDSVLKQRSQGVRVMTTPRGYTLDTKLPGVSEVTRGSEPKHEAPWLTVGAKTLNYVSSMAALRYARERGYDDVIYTEGDRILEGATSTVVIVKKNGKLRTPTPGGTILPGTTQAALFEYAAEHGIRAKATTLFMEDLVEAESVWLVSSTRLAVRVISLNGEALSTPSESHQKDFRDMVETALR